MWNMLITKYLFKVKSVFHFKLYDSSKETNSFQLIKDIVSHLLFLLIGFFEIPIILHIQNDCYSWNNNITMKGIPQTPIQLYKYLLRQIPRLPKESQSYYRNYVKGVCNSIECVEKNWLNICRIFVHMLMKSIRNVFVKSFKNSTMIFNGF